MKTFHTLSFGLGLGSGILILVILLGTLRFMRGQNAPRFQGSNGGMMREFPEGTQNPRRQRMTGSGTLTGSGTMTPSPSSDTSSSLSR